MKKIAFDIDGVLTDQISGTNKKVKREFGIDLKWDSYHIRDLEVGQEVKDFIINLWANEGYLTKLILLPGAIWTVRMLQSAGHEIIIVTSRENKWEEATKKQIYKYFRTWEFGDIPIFHSKKKVDILVEQKVDIFIDDCLEIANEVAINTDIKVLLRNWSYNRYCEQGEHPNINRINSVTEILDYV